MFFDSVPGYISSDELNKLWPHGWSKISKRFEDNKHALANAGAYVCCDICDWESSEHNRIKNARLVNYPSNAHLYRCSRGIKRPSKTVLNYDQFLDQRPDENMLTYTKTNTIQRDDSAYFFQYSHFERLYLDLFDILHLVGNVPPLLSQVNLTICYVTLEENKR